MDERDLIYDWNQAPGGGGFDWRHARVDLNDETLRDGLQSPSVRDPSLDIKKRLLHLMADLGIVAADLGLPGAGPRVVEQVRVLAREIRDHKLPIFPNCAARTVIADVEPVVRIAEEVGIRIEAATFIGSSPIRQYAEDWTVERILRSTEEAVTFAVRHGLPVMYVTEDTTRARPETLQRLYGAAIDCGATRICLADTVGHATPDGVKALVEFVKREIVGEKNVKIDWHGHRDRGMGLINCLAAIEAGVDRVHATALGLGERVGNAEMDLLIVNLKLLGAYAHDLSKLPEYCRTVADAVGIPIPINYPVMGTDAFRTGTGVHAAAIIKAKKKGHRWLADRVYSSVPAEELGLEQKIEITPVSGLSNVKFWLETHGYDADDEAACKALFEAAKQTDRALTDEECHRLVKQGRPPSPSPPSPPPPSGMAVGTLRELERSYFDLRWHMDPVAATQAGVTAYDDRYGDYTVPALAAHLAALKSLATALEETTSDLLDDEIDRTALLNEIRVALRAYGFERPQARSPEFWLSHLLGGLHHLLLRADRGPEARAAALAARLEQVPRLLEEARATLTEPVRVFAETGLRMAEGGLALIRQAAAVEGAHAPALAERLRAAGDAAVGALATFTHDLERWTETGSEHFALGEAGFNFRLHYEHALRDTAPELWRYGHRLKEEVQADLSERARRLDAETPWPDLVDRLRAQHPAAGELVAAYTAEMHRARDFVIAQGLVPVPDAPLEVVPTPAFMRPVIPFAAYDSPGAYSPHRTGWFYVTVPDAALPAAQRERLLRDHCWYELAGTALHEGFPGHHLHLVQAQAQASHVRKNLATPLTIEGWALYCEDMMAEQGFYAKEEERFFQRVHLLWRAVRVLLDVGLHTRGMTVEQAVDMMVRELHLERTNAEDEVRRYCATPGYQLCYAVGRRELLRLRDDFHAARGGGFTLRAFHEAILPYGGLSVTLIRWGLALGE